MYRRRGAWGKRPGSHAGYTGTNMSGTLSNNNSGYRWYGAYPTPITQLVVIASGILWTGGDGAAWQSGASALTAQAFVTTTSTTIPPRYAAMRDPYWHGVSGNYGEDNLVICGLTTTGGANAGTYSYGFMTIIGTVEAGQVFTINVKNGGTPITASYTALATDGPTSVFTQLQQTLLLQVLATGGSPPFLSPVIFVYTPSAQPNVFAAMWIGAAGPGSQGNSIQYEFNVTSGTSSASPTSYTNMTGGGSTSTAPAVWTGSSLTGLGWMYGPFGAGPPYQNGAQAGYSFTGCVTWHNHMWFFGDPNNQGKVYASDINQPQGLTFMAQYGGYPIGEGDGDPYVLALLPLGDTLYVFKAAHVYAITGYDFQQGEYQFQVVPVLNGYGTVSQETVAVLGSAAVFWTGSKMVRLANGSFDPEDIGATIPYQLGFASTTVQSRMRMVAGSFQCATSLNNQYAGGSGVSTPVNYIAADCLYFSFVDNNGNYTTLVYDDVATQQLQNYAWAPWKSTAWEIGFWIAEGGGPNAASTLTSEPFKLYYVPYTAFQGVTVFQVGANPINDATTPIAMTLQTGYMGLGQTSAVKLLEMMYADIESIGATQIAVNAIPAYYLKAQGNPTQQVPQASSGIAQTVAPAAGYEAFNTLSTRWEPGLRANAFMFQFSDSASSTSQPWELVGGRVVLTEEPLQT
jgi:hypothetical protein